MNISRQEASAALDSINAAGAAVTQRRMYAHMAPFLILWGLIWAACNSVSQFWPQWASRAWIAGDVVGACLTVWLGVAAARCRKDSSTESRSRGMRFAALGITIICFFVAMFLVLSPMTGKRMGAFISLFWTLAYMAAGAWIGLRLFMTGLIGTIGIVLSYLYAGQYFPLAMAIVGGGTLLAGGLWLRKV
jgi:hypothetical protein